MDRCERRARSRYRVRTKRTEGVSRGRERRRARKTVEASFPILQLQTKLNSRSRNTQHNAPHNRQSLFYFLSYIPPYIFFVMAAGVASDAPFNVGKAPEENFPLPLPRLTFRPQLFIRPSFLNISWGFLIRTVCNDYYYYRCLAIQSSHR